MGFWKVVGGMAAGVGIIVAAPVFGAIGTVTAVGAVVGAAAGGVAGAIASSKEGSENKSSYNAGQRQGYEQAKAEAAADTERAARMAKEMEERFQEQRKREELILAAFALGVAAANADGEISEEERMDLQEFISGLAYQQLSDHLRAEIERLYQNPPTFQDALRFVDRFRPEHLDMFDDVIEMIIYSDGVVHPKEAAFREAWNRYKAA